jgi:hypothetical protein
LVVEARFAAVVRALAWLADFQILLQVQVLVAAAPDAELLALAAQMLTVTAAAMQTFVRAIHLQ